MHFERGDVVVASSGEQEILGRVIRVLGARAACEVNFWDEKLKRFRVKDFDRVIMRHASVTEKGELMKAARAHNLTLVGPKKLACR